MVKPQVLLMGKLTYAREEFYDQVGAVAEIVEFDSPSLSDFAEKCKPSGEFADLKVIYHLHDPSHTIGKLDEEFYKVLPEGCKHICHFGAGYDDVDIPSATSHGIKVSHTPGAVDDATATTAVWLILGAMRRFWKAEKSLREGNWKNGLPLARDPENKVLGIVGMGGIGKVVANRMHHGWNMKVVYHNRKPVADESSLGFKAEYKESLDALLKEADVVSLHMPLSKATEKSFGKAQFDKMKPGAVLVNTARGGVIDEGALLEALESGTLKAAGLDVFPDEPNVNPELLKYDNVVLLPHMGTETTDSRHKMGMVVLQNVLDALDGKKLTNLVPEQKSS